jgi:Amt family ammonium transporter
MQMKANPYKTSSIQLVHIFNAVPRQVGAVPAPLLAPTIPLQLYSLFQLKFAIITPPIISGTANLQPSLWFAANARTDLHTVHLHRLLCPIFCQLKTSVLDGAGAFTERISFLPYCIFMLLFCLFVYCPMAHAVWHPNG